VKISYFPNWKVDGADGPYRVAPNFMVVIPRSTHVTLHYDMSSLDKVAYLLTLIGICLLFFWRYKGDIVHRSEHPFLVLAADGASLDDAGTDETLDDEGGGGGGGDATPVGADRPPSLFQAPDPAAAVDGPPVHEAADDAADLADWLRREQPGGPAGSV